MGGIEMMKADIRKLIVRAIEDGCVFLVMVIGIWLTCTVVGGVFRLLGVG
jgi:hypothetical protein